MANRALLFKLNFKNPWHLMAVGFGSGLAPLAPGTFGSLAAAPLCMIMLQCCSKPVMAAIAIVVFLLGIKACSEAEKAMGVHDHGGIVIDEFVGMFVTALAVPADQILLGTLTTFVLFRLFDILKPFPVCLADKKVSGGFGIMLDDVVAAIYALICNYLLFAFVF